jgi:hypothetical protein
MIANSITALTSEQRAGGKVARRENPALAKRDWYLRVTAISEKSPAASKQSALPGVLATVKRGPAWDTRGTDPNAVCHHDIRPHISAERVSLAMIFDNNGVLK